MKKLITNIKEIIRPITDAFKEFNSDERIFFWAIVLFSISYFTSALSILLIPIYVIVKRINIFRNKIWIPLALFSVIAIVSSIIAKYPLGILISVFVIVPTFCVTLFAVSSIRKEKLILFLRCFVILGLPAAVYAIIQLAIYMIFTYPHMPNPYVLRAFSTFQNASIYAVILMFYILISTALIIDKKERKYRGWYIASIVFSVIALVLTETRLVWPALICGLLLEFIVYKKYKIVGFFIAVCAACLAAFAIDHRLIPRFSDLNTSYGQRMDIWRCAVDYIKAHPFLAQGPLSFRMRLWHEVPVRDHAHNIILCLWSEYGLFGMLAAIWAFLMSFVCAVRQIARKCIKPEIVIAIAYFIAVLIFGVMDNPILNLATGFIFAFVLAVPFIMKKDTETDNVNQ